MKDTSTWKIHKMEDTQNRHKLFHPVFIFNPVIESHMYTAHAMTNAYITYAL